jgi:hypothetical protein
MKGFASLCVALVLVFAAVGCEDGTGGGNPPVVAPGVDDQPGEAKAYKAKQAELEAQRAEDIKNGKIPKPGSKKR